MAVLLSLSFLYGSLILAFTIGLLKTGRSVARGKPVAADGDLPGLVSVIIPVRNEAGNICSILGEMRGQDWPAGRLEVIVTDDFSEDNTMALASSFLADFPAFPLVLVFPQAGAGPGKKRAIARAIGKATGEVILCTDADTRRGPSWITSMAACFSGGATQMVLGPVCLRPAANLLQKIQALEFTGIMGSTAGSASLGTPVMCNGANLAYRRQVFNETGGYESSLRYGSGDDQFLMNAVGKRYGRKAIRFNFDLKAVVTTEPEPFLVGFIQQRIRWVSKSRGYREPVVIATGALTWLIHAALMAGFMTGIFFPAILPMVFGCWLFKMVMEFPMVYTMTGFFGQRSLLGWFIPAQLFQLCYVTLVGLAGPFATYRWKGRKGNN